MHYSSFPGLINVERTSEQCLQLLPPTENQKSLLNRIYTWVQGWMMDKWTMEMDQRGLYNGKNLHKKGIEKYKGRRLSKIHCSTRQNISSEIVNSSKTYSSDLSLTFDYAFCPPRTGSEPQSTVIKPITSLVLSPTLLQIYCIGLTGPISYSIWVWATNWDPTITKLNYFPSAFFVSSK